MNELILHRARARLRRELAAWQAGAVWLLVLSAVTNGAFAAALMDAREQLASAEAAHRIELEQAERTRDHALEKLGAVVLQMERDRQERAQRAAAFEAVGAWRYIGTCTVTAYCPCEECCGEWAGGLTSTGVPAVPGIVAVDPEVIPLGSTVIIDGQQYRAADTGVTGYCVDVCMAEHRETVAFGVQQMEVWIETEGGKHG